jgi:feruloyl-CoA synthase
MTIGDEPATTARPRLFAPPSVSFRQGDDGSIVLQSETALAPHAASVAGMFRAASAAAPERVLAAQRDGDGWRVVSYAQARAAADAIGQSLLDRKLGERPLMILSGNSIEHLLLTLGAHTVGIPVAPISVAYSLQSRDHAKLRAIVELADPGLVFADDGDAYAAAIAAVGGRELVTGSGTPVGGRAATSLAQLMGTRPTPEVERRLAEQTPDTVVKILFTSGSTGHPKGVLTTNRMLCANQQMMLQVWPFLAEDPPVLLDWLPWSHTFGGSHNLNMVLANGGSMWIDDGRPAPGLLERTLRNLRDVSPTLYFNVPAGYGALVPALEQDAELARRFFARLRIVFFAAAALPQQLWDRIERLAARSGTSAQVTTSWGATETGPAATSAHFDSGRSDCIGVPLPGVRLKLVPLGDKLEIRVKGPSVTPGYHRQPELTAAAFDDEGFYRTGDAVRLIDEAAPESGLRFDGRIAEDFKLSTGTWVSVGTLRPALLSAADGLLQDAVLGGHDADYVAALAWLNLGHVRRMAGVGAEVDAHTLAGDRAVRAALTGALQRLNRGAGSSQQIARLLVLEEPPSLDAGEITDKGYVNQRATLQRRRVLVERLFADPPHPDVIMWTPESRL